MVRAKNLNYVALMTAPPRPLTLNLPRRRLLLTGAGWLVAACSRQQPESDHPNAAFIDSQIPPGLAPQYFPPAGFVWSGFKLETLPEARYGVASPPLNPRANLLILADAALPGEVYFGLGQMAINEGVSLWILEAPGQGGSGKYLLQNQKIHTPDFGHSVRVLKAFVETIIKPSPDKSFYVLAHGSAALTALKSDTRNWPLKGLMIYAPWTGEVGPQSDWHRDNAPEDDWGRVAHRWQLANPDLRLKIKSDGWSKAANEALKSVRGINLSAFDPGARSLPISVYVTPEKREAAEGLCAGRKACEMKTIADSDALTPILKAFISSV